MIRLTMVFKGISSNVQIIMMFIPMLKHNKYKQIIRDPGLRGYLLLTSLNAKLPCLIGKGLINVPSP